ncbi:hypothetical protein [Streptomyces sp. NPDC050264]|uniref:hypothetical protein n=1 Tax=Streptomyces sp. NPDC050264 TaxID=3155038 RepID=UPI00341350D6
MPGQTHDPNEVTVQLDGAGRQLGGLLDAGRKPGNPRQAGIPGEPARPPGDGKEVPVFVDDSGRRSRTFRRVGVLVGIACAVYAVVIVITLLSGNSSAPWLPMPEGPTEKVDTKPVVPADSATPSTSPGVVPGPSASGTVPGTGATPGASGAPAPGTSTGDAKPGKGTGGTASGKPADGRTTPPAVPTKPGENTTPPAAPSTPPADPSTPPADPSGPASEPAGETGNGDGTGNVAGGATSSAPVEQLPGGSPSASSVASPESSVL